MGEDNNVIDTTAQDTGIVNVDNGNQQTDNSGAGASMAGAKPEDTMQGYLEIINQQTQQINALIEQTQRQQSEITRLIQNGAIITDGKQSINEPVSNASALGGFADYTNVDSEDFVSFRDLGKYVGTKEMI